MRRVAWSAMAAMLALCLPLMGCGDDDNGAECGNGVIEGTEACDASEFGSATCVTMGFTGGALSCTNTCTLDTSGCYNSQCGNGSAEGAEECDKDDLDDQTCASLGHTGGDLACTGTCTFDETGCVDTCGDNSLDTQYEQCDGTDFGTETCSSMGNFDGGTLGCSNDCQNILTTHCCTDQCTTDGQVTCNGTVLQTCETQANGCLGLTTHDCDDDGMICDSGATPPTCATACSSNCDTLDERRCNGDLLESCNQMGDCLQWQTDTDCSTTGFCVDFTNPPQCQASGGGDSCTDAEFVQSHVRYSGADFTADFTDTTDWSSNTGCGTANGADAVFQVYLNAGDLVRVAELGGLDAVVRVLDTCDATSACLDSSDSPEDISFTATDPGYYWAIVEAWSSSPSTADYDLLVEIYPPEVDCADASDNDMDGLTDCDDPNCFGQTGCTTETNCTDGQDNDGDTAVDCDDSDCDSNLSCTPIIGTWEEFTSSNVPDVDWCTISFTPDATTYDYTSTCGLTDLPVTPGSGTVSATTLTLGDSDAQEYTLSGSWSFDFFGTSYDSFWVGSNGFLTFGIDDPYASYDAADFFLYPRIAGYDVDFDPGDGGTIYVDELADSVVVTFEGIYIWNTSYRVTFQMVLHSNGDIDFHYGDVESPDEGMIGLSNGGQLGSAPAQTDFVISPPTHTGDIVITEIMYNPDVSDAAGEWVEIYNPTSSAFNLEGCTIHDDTVGNAHTFTQLIIPPGGYQVLARNADSTANGGITGAYEVGGALALGNSGDMVVITCGTTDIDIVDFDAGPWPVGSNGVTMQLNSHFLDAALNDNATSWCDGTDAFGSANSFGTPGAPNTDCNSTRLSEGFDSAIPGTWSIEDGGDTSDTWFWCDSSSSSCAEGDFDNATGGFAVVDSDAAGSGVTLDEGLVTPPVDCSGDSVVLLQFLSNFQKFASDPDIGLVEVSVDGGSSWTTVATYDTDQDPLGELITLDISSVAAGEADVRIRFYYTDGGGWDWYWMIDDVEVLGF